MIRNCFSFGMTSVRLLYSATTFLLKNSAYSAVAVTKFLYQKGCIGFVGTLVSFAFYQAPHRISDYAKKQIQDKHGEEEVTIYSKSAFFLDVSTSVYYTNLYAYTMPAQEKFFSGVNFFLQVEDDDSRLGLMKSSSNKILVGELFALSVALSDAVMSNEEFTAGEAYKLMKPIVKHGSVLGCKYLIDPTSMLDVFGPKGKLMTTSAVCNMVGEVVEGLTKTAYTAVLAEKTDYYKVEELLSDFFFSIYKTFHQKGEKYSGMFLSSISKIIDGNDNGFFTTALENFPLHYYVGGFIRKVVSKFSSISSEKIIGNLKESVLSLLQIKIEQDHENVESNSLDEGVCAVQTEEETPDWAVHVQLDFNCVMYGDCEESIFPNFIHSGTDERYKNSSSHSDHGEGYCFGSEMRVPDQVDHVLPLVGA